MNVYINGAGVISAQQTFDKGVCRDGVTTFEGNRWSCIEPDYSQFIDGKQIRRMSKIIRMGIVASMLATREAAVDKPEAIIVGTAFGCMEDTYSFLSKLVQYKEDMLSPTAFIHSTHNTIAAQIALLFQCHGYNSTYVHRAQSFESALTDALLLFEEGAVENMLVGGIDEITNTSFTIKQRFNFYKDNTAIQKNNFYNLPGKGSAAGEGAAFFSLSGTHQKTSYAKVVEVELISNISVSEMAQKTSALLQSNGLSLPDLLMTGHNGDTTNDSFYDSFVTELNCVNCLFKYKHLCGEYATSSSFAMWLAAEILNEGRIPKWLSDHQKNVKNILIYNQQEGYHHSLILLEAC